MDYGTNSNYTSWEKSLALKGYFHIRDHYPFGRHSTMANKSGRILIRYYGKWRSWEQVKSHLRIDWSPASTVDQLWFDKNIGGC